MKNKLVHVGIISIFCSLYFLVATISMINSVAFFDLAHEGMMNWSLAIGFELGAAASLAAIIILDKTNRFMVWTLFLLLTAFQMMANSYHAFINLEAYMGWIELFGLEEMEPLAQKRILAIVSGAVLPIVALGFIKSLVDYIRPETTVDTVPEEKVFDLLNEDKKEIKPVIDETAIKAQQEQIIKIGRKQIEKLKARVKENQAVLEREDLIVDDLEDIRDLEDDWGIPNPDDEATHIPEANPIPVGVPHVASGAERQIAETIKQAALDENINAAINPTSDTSQAEVDVTIKDNITYVKTRKKA